MLNLVRRNLQLRISTLLVERNILQISNRQLFQETAWAAFSKTHLL